MDTTAAKAWIQKKWKTLAVASAIISALLFSGNACTSTDYQQRQEQNQQNRVQGESQEQRQLKEKIRRDEASADKIGYVYVLSMTGQPIGYFTIKGKVSSNGSQLAPEDEIVCKYNTGESCQTVDGPQDDNTYGQDDPGVFFFTTEGAKIETTAVTFYSDQPIMTTVNIPKWNK